MSDSKQLGTCDHKCHQVGLNPWIFTCPICGCENPKYDASVPVPQTLEELLALSESTEGYDVL